MLTQAEVQRILNQVNDAFSEDRKRLDRLEARVKALEPKESLKPATAAPKTAAKE